MSFSLSKEETAQEMDRLHRGLIEHGVMRSCINCSGWGLVDSNQWGCKLAGKRPPPDVLVFGCTSWRHKEEPEWNLDDAIPF